MLRSWSALKSKAKKKGRCNMKFSDNQIIRILSLVFVAAVMAGVQKSTLAGEPVPANNTTGSGATSAINDYQFQGTVTLIIHGQEKSADLLVTVLAEPEVDANGVQHVVATHTFTFADGSSLTTSDEETAEPTSTPGLYTLTANMEVVSGTVIYEWVSGHIAAYGKIDSAAQPPTAQFELIGAMSFCGDMNHPYPVGDLDQDCRVDLADLAIFCSHWLEDSNP